jgi:hypothetical protein
MAIFLETLAKYFPVSDSKETVLAIASGIEEYVYPNYVLHQLDVKKAMMRIFKSGELGYNQIRSREIPKDRTLQFSDVDDMCGTPLKDILQDRGKVKLKILKDVITSIVKKQHPGLEFELDVDIGKKDDDFSLKTTRSLVYYADERILRKWAEERLKKNPRPMLRYDFRL